MASLARRLLSAPEERATSLALPFQQWVDFFKFNGTAYPLSFNQTLTGDHESISGDYSGLVEGAYKQNGIVFACMLARMLHFTEARFQYQQLVKGRPGNLFGDASLSLLEAPWPNGTTRDLLARMIQDVDLAGNAYILKVARDRLFRLRPDWVDILLSSSSGRSDWQPGDPDTTVAAFVYYPGGRYSGRKEQIYRPEQVAHYAPIPDPSASYRGMSWLTPVIRETMADQSMTTHRLKFFENGATVNLVVSLPKEAAPTVAQFQEWVKVLRDGHEGAANAYRMMFLGMGADVTPIGANLQQVDFKAVQGAGEVRIAAAARIPPTLLGISEGLQGSTLNAGNYQSARRNFADGLLRPMWGAAAGALAVLVPVFQGARLWYDDRDIAFLKEDMKDAAEVRQADAATIKSLIDSGFKPDAIIDAVVSDDFSRLAGQHTGLTSVQLTPPATGGTAMMNGSNGAGKGVQPMLNP